MMPAADIGATCLQTEELPGTLAAVTEAWNGYSPEASERARPLPPPRCQTLAPELERIHFCYV